MKYRIVYRSAVYAFKMHEFEAADDNAAVEEAANIIEKNDGELYRLDARWTTEWEVAGDEMVVVDRLDETGVLEDEVGSGDLSTSMLTLPDLQDFVRLVAEGKVTKAAMVEAARKIRDDARSERVRFLQSIAQRQE